MTELKNIIQEPSIDKVIEVFSAFEKVEEEDEPKSLEFEDDFYTLTFVGFMRIRLPHNRYVNQYDI